ncbi:TOPRIM domain containing protein [uncultured Caudovirales phage]|uniref:TOPRIM domain containing protein n=1 Tax=uncultured Caudovirales phage TaxID=2100421 RepID=A0A6J7X1X5_9CAUD|nr:TOPRIM domain containing protein [uncultured Caudovirales phage]
MRKTCDAARGKWKGILLSLGMDAKHLTGKHGPCPLCGGSDRFRFDNKDGSGSYICGQCGAGSGMDLLKAFKGWEFRDAAQAVDEVLGNVPSDPPGKPALSDDNRRRLMNALWKASVPVEVDCPAGWYLSRRVPGWQNCPDLRFAESAPVPGGGTSPALLALVRDHAGNPATIHRTFLTLAGEKAGMENPRAMMPGELPESIAVHLSPAAEVMGIAEGIETALAAQAKFGVPCHAALTAGFMAKWQPPEGVKRVVIFGDCDQSYTGQAAAYTLAHRLSRKLQVEVRIPGQFGTDWADEVAA